MRKVQSMLNSDNVQRINRITCVQRKDEKFCYLEVLQQRVDVLLAAVPVLAGVHPVGAVGRAHVAGVLLKQTRVQGDLGEQRYQVVVAHLKVKQIRL